MKRIVAFCIAFLLIVPIFAQEAGQPVAPESPDNQEPVDAVVPEPESTVSPQPEVAEVPETPETDVTPAVPAKPDGTRVTLGENEVFIIEENGDTMKVVLGSRGLRIVEGKDGTEINVIEMDEVGSGDGDDSGSSAIENAMRTRKRSNKFRPHFAGVDLGLNNFVTPDFSMSLPQNALFMDLNTGRSWNVNLNFIEYGLPLGTNKLGLVTGLGFEFTNYVFDNASSIEKDGNGMIVEYIPLEADNIVKSKFNMTYLTAPLLLEIQIPGGRRSFHLSGGIIGGVKVASNTKIKYEISGQKSKEKSKGDYNLAPLRYGATVRVGYRALNFFANYYFTPLFGEGGGPELYPISVGLTLVPF